jgi:capsular exopolysaccharide synthesis family protein
MGREQAYNDSVDLREYLAPLMRQKRLIALVAILVLAAAAAYTFTRTPVYKATATVLLKPTGVNLADLGALGSEKLLNLETEMQLVKSTAVATNATAALGGGMTPAEALKHVSVNVVPDSQALEISYTDPDPTRAQKGAMAFARGYLDDRQAQAEDLVTSQIDELNAKLAAANARITELNATIASTSSSSPEYRDAKTELETVGQSIVNLTAQVDEADLLNTDPGQVIVVPQVPTHPSSPNHPRDLGLGLFLGLGLGIVLAFARGRTDQRLHEATDLEGALGVPLLASIPKVPEGSKGREGLISIEDPGAPAAEAYRALRTTLMAAFHRGGGTLLVVSSLPGEGKTTVAANLSVMVAQADRRVVVISADMRRPRLHELFGLSNGRGLSSVLGGDRSLPDCVFATQLPNLLVCPAGPIPPDPAEMLQSERMRQLIATLRQTADFVVLDCPPVLTVADPLGLAAISDAALFVIDSTATKRSDVAEARYRLEQVGGTLLGGVLNKMPAPTRGRYGYGYGYGYSPNGAPTSQEPGTTVGTPGSGPALHDRIRDINSG